MAKRQRFFLDPKNRRGELRRGCRCWWGCRAWRAGCDVATELTGNSWMNDNPHWCACTQGVDTQGNRIQTALLPWEV